MVAQVFWFYKKGEIVPNRVAYFSFPAQETRAKLDIDKLCYWLYGYSYATVNVIRFKKRVTPSH